MSKELWQKPHSRPCLERREAASCRPLSFGCAVGCRHRAWHAHPAMPPGHRGHAQPPERWQGLVLQGAALGFTEEPGVSHAARVMLCPLMIWIQKAGRLPPSAPLAGTTQVVQEDHPFLPAFSFRPWTQKAR